MKYKRLVDLTDDDIRVIVAFLFDTKKIGNITRDYKNDEINCQVSINIYHTGGVFETTLILKNPFECNGFPISVGGHEISSMTDYRNFVGYCFAKGVVARMWVKDNKWLAGGENE